MIGLINVPWGNSRSLKVALKRLNLKFKVISDSKKINECTKIIFPGVGNFSTLVTFLDNGWREVLKEEKKPFLGICLGMHALFKGSDESEGEGLGIIDEKIKELPINPCPHMGWNNAEKNKGDWLLEDFFGEDFYFSHSYGISRIDESISITKVDHFEISSSVKKNNFIGLQFHPEKSGEVGLEILKKFGKKI